ncbi:40S ribosomal protein S29 isoform X1 [Aix galericulata]|nr:40S ribosomal protein S29 isoform X1 [Aix galericulata]
MGHQQLYWSHPRKFGQGSRSCRVCSNRHGLIRKYGLNMCRQCFRQYAKDIGFIKRLEEPLAVGCSTPPRPCSEHFMARASVLHSVLRFSFILLCRQYPSAELGLRLSFPLGVHPPGRQCHISVSLQESFSNSVPIKAHSSLMQWIYQQSPEELQCPSSSSFSLVPLLHAEDELNAEGPAQKGREVISHDVVSHVLSLCAQDLCPYSWSSGPTRVG